jgi:hypothetical protein
MSSKEASAASGSALYMDMLEKSKLNHIVIDMDSHTMSDNVKTILNTIK